MSIRKRTWYRESDVKAEAETLAHQAGYPGHWKDFKREARRSLEARGVPKQVAWIVDYVDTKKVRRQKTFTGKSPKKAAEEFAATARVEVREGVHVADSASVTVETAGKFWLATAESSGLERSTVDQYRQHLDLHIAPFIGATLLSKLSVPSVRDFEDQLLEQGRSSAMVRKILVSLSSLLSDAQERGLATRNPVRDMRAKRGKGRDRVEKRQRSRLRVGEDIPTRDEIKALVGVLEGRWRPLLLTAIFTGLRASEIRGLRWHDVDIEGRALHVRQRADRYNEIGRPKSEAGERTIPAPPIVINALREWRLACPKGDLGLVFPNGAGNVESHANLINRALVPSLIKAGVTVPAIGDDGMPLTDDTGKPVVRAKYTGMHSLRHFYASWLINRQEDGGLGLPPKSVQDRLGHATITMTLDVYGHLFPRGDDADELAAAEAALLS